MRIIGPALAVVVIGAGIALTAPSVAHAGSNLCNANRDCIYEDSNFVGLLGMRGPGGGLVNMTAGANDIMSSWATDHGC